MTETTWQAETVMQPQTDIPSNCLVIAFYNNGSIPAIVNGDTIQPGESRTLPQQPGNIDTTIYRVSWSGTTGGKLQVWKNYVGKK